MRRTRPLLLLRVDVTHAHGTGHLMRGKALADAWQRAHGEVEIATTSDLAPYAAWLGGLRIHPIDAADDARATAQLAAGRAAAWIAADGYHFDSAWQAVAGRDRRLLLFDDHGHGAPPSADLVLNQNPGADAALYRAHAGRTRLLRGARFAVLREIFQPWREWRRTTPERAQRVLVTFGGTDPTGMTRRVVPALRALRELEFEILLGAGNADAAEIQSQCAGAEHLHVRRNVTDMPALIAGCDLALCAAGSTTLECAFLQTPQLLITVADNQRGLAAGLTAAGAAEHLGWHTEVSAETIAAGVERLAADAPRRAAMSTAAGALVDGHGAARVVAQMRGDLLTLRPVERRDAERLFAWANDPATRAASFESGPIEWATHLAWLERRLQDPATHMWIALDGAEPIGVVRFALEKGGATISLVIAPERRGAGWGPALIARASRELFRDAAIERIHAFIKPANTASLTAFLHADYERVGTSERNGAPAAHFLLTRI
jgi:UDP-2,4-diacetamido-2,4,6-trideoxy-beta-L-altropyranose hydrolase